MKRFPTARPLTDRASWHFLEIRWTNCNDYSNCYSEVISPLPHPLGRLLVRVWGGGGTTTCLYSKWVYLYRKASVASLHTNFIEFYCRVFLKIPHKSLLTLSLIFVRFFLQPVLMHVSCRCNITRSTSIKVHVHKSHHMEHIAWEANRACIKN
jgi:hypothetical protein